MMWRASVYIVVEYHGREKPLLWAGGSIFVSVVLWPDLLPEWEGRLESGL